MSTRKNNWVPALLLVLTLVLTGCGSSEPQGGQVTPNTEAAATQPVETAQSAETEQPTEPAETEATEAPVSLGRLEGGIYTNAYAGFGCEMDDSWTFYSAEELQEIPENAKNALEGSDIGEELADLEQITDMMAENADLLANVNVLYTKQDMTERLAMMAFSEEEIIDITLENKDEMIAGYEQAGIHVSSIEKVQLTFLGENRWCLKTVAETEEIPLYNVQMFDFQKGAYSVTLTITCFVEDNTQTILDLFYPV